jgi:catechol-2,3-dioxygenase
MVVNHGNAIGCYFRDPEENVVEVYWHTGRDWPQPYADPIDLSRSEEELLDIVAAL